MSIRLAPGGKALMVLLGLGIIFWGLRYGGYLASGDPEEISPGDKDPSEVSEKKEEDNEKAAGIIIDDEKKHEARESEKKDPLQKKPEEIGLRDYEKILKDHDLIKTEKVESPEKKKVPPPLPCDEISRIIASDQEDLEKSEPKTLNGHPDYSAPPLFGEMPRELAVSSSDTGDLPDILLKNLVSGETDIVFMDLHDLIFHAELAKSIVVIGAREPEKPLYFCTTVEKAGFFEADMVVGVDRISRKLPASHVFEVAGIDLESIIWVVSASSVLQEEADVLIVDIIPENRECISLFRTGAQGPELILARENDVRLYGKSFQELALMYGDKSLWRNYLVSKKDLISSYENHAGYLSGLFARMKAAPPIDPPPVADWFFQKVSR